MPTTLTINRYPTAGRVPRENLIRKPWRTRTRQKKKHQRTVTAEEKKAAKQATQDRKRTINKKVDTALAGVWTSAESLHRDIGTHTPQYWYEFLLQAAGKKTKTRRPSTWNAFVSQKVKSHNDALPEGATRVRPPALMAQLTAEWSELTEAEKVEATIEGVAHLEEVREMKEYGTHNVAVTAFHDARAHIGSAQQILERGRNRTGTEFLLIGCRTNSSSFLNPLAWTTTDSIDDYFQLQTKRSTGEFAGMLESYMLSGLDEAIKESGQRVLNLKTKVAKVIFDKLVQAAKPHKISRMYYTGFEHHITEKYGILVKNWPLSKFASPSTIGSQMELEILLNAWQNDAAYFERLSPSELAKWRADNREAVGIAPSPDVTATSPADGAGEVTPLASASTPVPSHATPPPPPSPVASTSTAPVMPSVALQTVPPSVTPVCATGIFSFGTQELVAKKPRKKRSDAGVKKGPRKKRSERS